MPSFPSNRTRNMPCSLSRQFGQLMSGQSNGERQVQPNRLAVVNLNRRELEQSSGSSSPNSTHARIHLERGSTHSQQVYKTANDAEKATADEYMNTSHFGAQESDPHDDDLNWFVEHFSNDLAITDTHSSSNATHPKENPTPTTILTNYDTDDSVLGPRKKRQGCRVSRLSTTRSPSPCSDTARSSYFSILLPFSTVKLPPLTVASQTCESWSSYEESPCMPKIPSIKSGSSHSSLRLPPVPDSNTSDSSSYSNLGNCHDDHNSTLKTGSRLVQESDPHDEDSNWFVKHFSNDLAITDTHSSSNATHPKENPTPTTILTNYDTDDSVLGPRKKRQGCRVSRLSTTRSPSPCSDTARSSYFSILLPCSPVKLPPLTIASQTCESWSSYEESPCMPKIPSIKSGSSHSSLRLPPVPDSNTSDQPCRDSNPHSDNLSPMP